MIIVQNMYKNCIVTVSYIYDGYRNFINMIVKFYNFCIKYISVNIYIYIYNGIEYVYKLYSCYIKYVSE